MRAILLFAAMLAALASTAEAKVIEKSPTGFKVQYSADLKADAATAYATFVKVGAWWGMDHSYSGDAKNISIDTKPGGCWCEMLPDGGFVKHMEVLHAAPGVRLIFSGGLGPLAFSGVAGSMVVTFKPGKDKGTTTATLTYAVGGHDEGEFKAIADGVDGVLAAQFTRYANVVNTGKP